MIRLNKEKRQEINRAIEDFNGHNIDLYDFVRTVLSACGMEEDGKENPEIYDPFCDDPECGSCNGLGADGHHY